VAGSDKEWRQDESMKYRRKRYIVDRRLQFRLLMYNGVYFLIITVAIWAGLFLPLALDLSNPDLNISQQGEVAGKILYLHSRLGPILLIVFLILAIHSVLISHRIAGPLYRFKATFNQVAQGDLSKVVAIRKGDLLVNEQTKIEEMIGTLISMLKNIKKEHAAMEKALQSLLNSQGNFSENLSKEAIAQLEGCHLRMKKELEYFKLSDMDLFEIGEIRMGQTDEPLK
jgi:methyl-accepting chemotaxis protein